MYLSRFQSAAATAFALAAALSLGACSKKVDDASKAPGSSSSPMGSPSSSNTGTTGSSPMSSPPATTDSAATPPATGSSAPKY